MNAGARLDIDERVTGALECRHQLVQFQVDGPRVLVLRPLDEEHHQERDDRGAGVDHQLPGVTELEQRPGDRPHRDYQQRKAETQGPPGEA